ncbi:MAG: hypothetical protein ABSD64_01470 [Terriglobales bacterium]|jgi:hypothetical protein
MKRFSLLLVFAAAISFAQEAGTPPAPLTPAPTKPTCNPNNLFTGRDCKDKIKAYDQAMQQRQHHAKEVQQFVDRQKDLATAQATAPLQQQIADQQGQIKSLQDQMQADATAALQAKSDAHKRGLWQGTGIGVAASLLGLGLFFGIKRYGLGFTVTRKPQGS